MDRARAAHLISGGLAWDEADQAEDFSHGDPGPDFSEANTRHAGDLKTRSEVIVARGAMPQDRGREQRRGTRNRGA